MLFQPTNITPSSFAGAGGDLVLAGHDMIVTWQVNGTSPMTAYQITIYENTAASTQLYTTGKVTLTNPFYGVDGMGTVQLFSATIDSDDLTTAGVVTGSSIDYKYKIKQWWGTNDAVDQSAENYFIIQSEPSVSITTSTLSSPSSPIVGSYSQSESVGLDWVRWVIELADPDTNLSTGTVLLDSGKIHTQQLRYAYDGWISGTKYYVKLSYQLQNGYTGSTNAVVTASWTDADARAIATAALTDGCSAAYLRYPVPTYAVQSATTTATVQNGRLVITDDSETLTWNGIILTGQPAHGGLVWCGIPEDDVTMTIAGAFAIGNTPYRDNTLRIVLDPSAGTLTWTAIGDDENETGTFTVGETMTGKMVTVIACGSTWYVIVSALGNAVVAGPNTSTEAFPGASVSINGTSVTDTWTLTINGTTYNLMTEPLGAHVHSFTSPISGEGWITLWDDSATVTLAGEQYCMYFGVLSGNAESDAISNLLSGETEQPDFNADWIFLSDFAESGTNLGMLPSATGTPQTNSIIVYRKERGSSVMEKLFALTGQTAMTTADIGRLLDYGVVSGKVYSYVVCYAYDDGNGNTTYAMSAESGEISPCYWDWMLTTAQKHDDGTYRMTGTYRFGLNLETGAMSNNNMPSIMQNFTRYPTRQGVSANYRSGSLTSFIGNVDKSENTYVDTEAQAEAILSIGASTDAKFLRNRKGAKWMVDTASATTVQTGDKYREQPYSATLSWVETGDANGVPVICVPTDGAWPDSITTMGTGPTYIGPATLQHNGVTVPLGSTIIINGITYYV